MSQNDTLPALNGLAKGRENNLTPIDNQVVTIRATFSPADTKSKEHLYTQWDYIKAMEVKQPLLRTLIKTFDLKEDF